MSDSRSAHDIQTDVAISTAFQEAMIEYDPGSYAWTYVDKCIRDGHVDGLSIREFRKSCAEMGFRVEIKLVEDHT